MPTSLAQRAKRRTTTLYAVGILAFSAMFGFITLFALFVSHLK